MLKDHKKLQYPTCEEEQKKLGTTLELLKWKAKNGVFDKGFGELPTITKKMLSKANELPATTYSAKQVIFPLGLEIQKMHACPNDCILLANPRGPQRDRRDAPNKESLCEPVRLHGCV